MRRRKDLATLLHDKSVTVKECSIESSSSPRKLL